MITINMAKAKTIAHVMRRRARADEFTPLDEIIMKQIPGTDAQAIESQRQAIREKYSGMQNAIDTASTPEELKEILGV